MQAHTVQEGVEVLQLVVQHCPTPHLPVKTLCSILQVSRAVNEALQQALGHCSLELPRQQRGHSFDVALSRLGACCSWLNKHASLVTELHWHWKDPDYNSMAPFAFHYKLGPFPLDAAAQHLIALCLAGLSSKAQAVAAAAAATAAGALSAPLHGPRAVLPATAAVIPWQLQRVTLQHLVTPMMLDSLVSCTTLTKLLLYLDQDSSEAALFAALGRMQQLLDLHVHLHRKQTVDHHTSQPVLVLVFKEEFALVVQQLTRLRSLELSASNTTTAVVCDALPASLQALTAHLGTRARGRQPRQAIVVDMAHAVSLKSMKLSVDGTLGAASQLPPHLTQITLDSGGLGAIGGLLELKKAVLEDGKACIPFLQHCSALQKLEALTIDVGHCDVNAPAAGGSQDVLQLLAGIAGAQHLTSLVVQNAAALEGGVPYPSPKDLLGTRLHPHLRRLTALQHLDISSLDIEQGDAVHFTCLTALTALHLYNCWSVVEVAVAAVVVKLKGLRVLELIDCGLESPVLWPAVGVCTSLESLCIDSAPHKAMVLDDDTLHLLTSLTRLTALTGPDIKATAAAYEAFTAAMPALVKRPRFGNTAVMFGAQ